MIRLQIQNSDITLASGNSVGVGVAPPNQRRQSSHPGSWVPLNVAVDHICFPRNWIIGGIFYLKAADDFFFCKKPWKFVKFWYYKNGNIANFNVESITNFYRLKIAFKNSVSDSAHLQVKAIKSIEISTCFVQETHPTPQPHAWLLRLMGRKSDQKCAELLGGNPSIRTNWT